MALNTKFNAKNGISVGVPSVSIIDNVGNAIFPTVSAGQYLGLQPSLSGLAALVGGNSLGSALTIGTNDSFNLNLETGGSNRIVIDSAGASVATTCLLQVGSGGVNNNGEIRARVLRLSDDTGNSTAKIYSTSAFSRDLIHHASEHKFGADNIEFVRFTYGQRVGIGTTTPIGKLDIADTTSAGSSALSGSVLNLTQTWATSGAPTSIKLNVTDTSSSANSLLMDLQIGSRSSYSFGKTTLTLPPSATSGIVWPGISAQNRTCSITRAADDTLSISAGLGNGKIVNIGGDGYGLSIQNGLININTGLRDVRLSVDDHNILAQRNSVSPQAFRLYNTYSNATTFERLNLRWDTNTVKIGTEKGSGGGLARDLAFETDASTRMTVSSSGNVGIGTIYPTERLNVVGNVKTEGNLSVYNLNTAITLDRLTVDGSQGRLFTVTDALTGSLLSVNDISGLPILEVFDDDRVIMGEYASNALAVVGKNVGIGTASPSQKLTVVGVISSTNVIYASGGNSNLWNSAYSSVTAISSNSSNYILDGGNTKGANLLVGTNDNFNLNLETGGITRMTVTNAGNVGIGTTSPAGKLEVNGTGNVNWVSSGISSGTITVGDYISGGSLFVRTPGYSSGDYHCGLGIDGSYSSNVAVINVGAYGVKSSPYSSRLSFSTTNNSTITQAMMINHLGDVGIGRITPLAKLDVNGTTFINATGDGGTGAKLTVGGTGTTIYTPGAVHATGGLVLSTGNNVSQVNIAGGNIVNVNGLQIANSGPVLSYISGAGIKVLQSNGTTYGSVNAGTLALGSTYAGVAAPTDGAIIEGNVGISTTSPNERLTVVGNISSTNVVYASGGNSNLWNSAYSSVTAISANTANYILDGGNTKGANLLVGTNDNFNLNLETAGTTRMTVTSAGIVSIMPGQTTAVGTGLRIYDNSIGNYLEISQQYGDFAFNTTAGNQRYTFYASGNSLAHISTTNSYFIAPGNFGIGTSIPTAKLDIVDTTLAGSGVLSGSILNLTQTWNTTGNPTAFTLNVTNSASGASSNLLDLRVGGSSKFKVGKGATGSANMSLGSSGGDCTFSTSGNLLTVGLGSHDVQLCGSLQVMRSNLQAATFFLGHNDTSTSLAPALLKDANYVLAQRNGVNAQTYRLYNTYTNANNYSRLSISADLSGNSTLTTEASGTGVAGIIQINGITVGRGGGSIFSNTAVGSGALVYNTTGTSNTAVGNDALSSSDTGSNNTAVGRRALWKNISGLNNTALGTNALDSLLASNNNVAIGRLAGSLNPSNADITALSNSVLIGADTRPLNAATDTNCIAIGYIAYGQGSNSVVLGNNNITNTYLKGAVQIHRSAADASNYERIAMRWNGLVGTIGTGKLGSGVARDLAFETNDTTRVTITSGGNVGIGTTTPTTPLTIVADGAGSGFNVLGSSGNFIFQSGGVNGAGLISQSNISTAGFLIGTDGGSSNTGSFLRFQTQGSVRAVIDNNGNTGIGTTTPNEKLTVVGAISSTNVVYASGGNSDLWNSAYTSVTAINATSTSTYTTVNSNSAKWGGVFTTTNTNSANWSGVYTTTNANSANWNSVYSSYNTASAALLKSTISSSGQGNITIPRVGGGNESITLSELGTGGNPSFNNLTVSGSLSVVGDFTYLNTSVSVTSALSVVNTGTGPALLVRQSGTTPIAHFIDADGTGDIIFENNGFVGLGVASPTQRLAVAGNITSTNVIYASSGNSDLWSSAFTITNANSANWSSVYTLTNANSANWSSVYTTTNANSANWNSVYTTTNANSANWSGVYTSTNANSANWNSVYSTVNANSANYILAGGNSRGTDVIIGTNDNFALNLETAGTTKISITSGGLVGVGTTSTPVTRLQINNRVVDAAGYVYDTDTLLVTHQTPTATATLNDPKTVLVLARQGTSGQAFGAAAAFNLSRFENSGTDSRTRLDINLANGSYDLNSNNVLTLLSNGNVGMGTSAPTARLHVVGSTKIATGLLDLDSGYAIRWGGAASGIYSGPGTSDMVITVGSAERLRINGSSGNIGIGTIVPNEKLTVVGNISSFNAVYASGGNSNLWNSAYTSVNAISANSASTFTTVNANSANWSSVYTTTNANSANWNSVYTTVNAASANYILDGGNSKGANLLVGTNDNFNLNFETAGTTKMTIASAGSVGIGTTAPGNKLHVLGTANGEGLRVAHSAGAGTRLDIIAGDASQVAPGQVGFLVNGSGALILNSAGLILPASLIRVASDAQTININGGYSAGTLGNSLILGSNTINGGSFTATSGTQNIVSIGVTGNESWNPASGNATYNLLRIVPTVNTSGTYAGIVRGLYINPTLTSVIGVDFRALDLSNTSGFGVYQSGASANNYFAGNVGIGTTTPNEKLTVVGAISSTNVVYASGGNSNLWNSAYTSVTSINASSTSTYTTVNANSANWSGVFTTTNANSANWNSVYTTTNTSSANWNSVYTTTNANSANWNSVYTTTNANSANYILDGGNTKGANLLVGTNDNFNLNLETAGTTKMTVTSSGNVGIGTTSIQAKLDVNGDTRAGGFLYVDRTSGNLTSYFQLKARGAAEVSNYGNPVGNGAAEFGAVGMSGLIVGTQNATPLVLGTSNAERVRITATGDVGIGTVSPNYKLEVVGNGFFGDSTTAGTALTVSTGAGSVNKGGLSIINSPAVTYTALSLQTNWSDGNGGDIVKIFNSTGTKFLINNNGNVGIGTATPNEKLTVTGNISASNIVYATGGNSSLWNSAYTTANAISANSVSTFTTVNANSANWNSVYTTTNANSANWTSAYTSVNTNSPNWNSVYTTTNANSANWSSTYTAVTAISAISTSVYTTTNTNSANWSSVYSTVNANSANYILDGGNTKGANLLVGTNDGFALNFETNGTTKMSVTSAGNVGIGTTTPTSKLEIVDTTSAISLSGAALNIAHTWNAPGIDVTAIKLNVSSSASGANSKLIDLQIGGTSYFNVDKTGATTMASAVFVNGGNSNQWNSNYTTTNTNSAKWNSDYTTVNTSSASWSSVYSTVNAASANYIVNGGNTTGGTITIGTNDANNFNLESNGTARISMSATGQVGVGTLTPDVDFVVYKNVIGSPTTFKIRTATGTGSRQDFYRTDGYVATRFDVLSTNEFQFYNNNDVATPKYIINGTNGNFGIGTTSTVHKVTVGGSLSASGTLYGDCAVLGDATASVSLERDAANTLGIRTTTAAQTLNVYGTYTSGTNFERLTLAASALGGVIGHYAGGGGGVARDLIFQTSNTTRMTIAAAGSVNVAGHFSAATKSFLIDHPTQEGKKLQYGVVESNQHSVLVRGKTSESIIELPEEWLGLVHEDSVTVQLTPIGSYQQLYVVTQDNQRVVVGGSTGQYNYTIYGERKDVDKLQTVV